MNILTSQIQQQKPEVLEMVCQIHQLEIIALDLDTSEKGQFQYLCCYCLVDKMNNNKISTIEQTKDRISSLKTQKKENKTKEIQKRLDYFKNILDQIMDFKNTVENTLEKLYSQIKAQIHTVQQEKQLLLEGVQVQQNFQDDVKSLSQFLSSEYQGKQIEFQQDSQFIDEIFKQFELLFNNASYFQTIDAFKDAKQKINEINENFQIELMPQQNKNNYKTPSLNKICPMHNKEIIMIDMDTKKKKVDDRFACVDCISDHPHCQYRTIEKVNQEWNSQKQQQDRVLNDLKLKRKEKQAKLNQQVALIRKNYNQQINEISEKIITEFSTPINQTNDICKFKQTSLQGLTNEELVSNINYLIEYDKENQFQDSKIVYAKSKDLLFVKEIENKLEHLKQHNQLDIQESLNILKEDNRIQGINLLFQQILESTKGNQEQLILKQDLEELLNSSKQIYCQQGLFNQTIHKFQEHLIKINNINNKMKQIPDHINLTFFQKCVQDYTDKFQNDFHQLKKFCDIENLENKLNALQIDYKKLEQEKQQNRLAQRI
ncbi:unnamed protein product [Paramecium octaurelia]|uniref:Uncharacterized protein n=1 Tax=Paramecium octaurelia TaxID=43137 RepID=A0A8S1VMH6_PAROT|nr:unnamed protein product [Paramecium octaurelia]